MIYLDSSALLKLLFQEAESTVLADWLSARMDVPVVSSELAKIEVRRACRRLDPAVLPEAQAMLAGMDLVPMTSDLVEQAAEVGEPLLRSLDAIHMASAMGIRSDLSAFVAYDRRLAAAASAAGIPVVLPAGRA